MSDCFIVIVVFRRKYSYNWKLHIHLKVLELDYLYHLMINDLSLNNQCPFANQFPAALLAENFLLSPLAQGKQPL